jgi:ABC-type nickel/cobalt efflux system permease component RcnA
MQTRNKAGWHRGALAALATIGLVFFPSALSAHPMGNFSISHYAGIRLEGDFVEIRYLIDMAEIPTFQEMRQTGIGAQPEDPKVVAYLADRAETLKQGLVVTINGKVLALDVVTREILFSQGAGNLPTAKFGIVYRGVLPQICSVSQCQLSYRDVNYPERAGWKEVIVNSGQRIAVENSTAPARDRSAQLSNYPTDLVTSPPQELEAEIFFHATTDVASASARPAEGKSVARMGGTVGSHATEIRTSKRVEPTKSPASAASAQVQIELKANQQSTPKNAFTELMAAKQIGLGVALLAALIAAGLGALHALEPGHGKTIVAAYLVGSRGTAYHAVLLGMIVTVSHTAGVYLLGAVTLYAQKYILPDRLYPFLGVLSGMLIAGMGFYLFLQRYAGADSAHSHGPGGHQHLLNFPPKGSDAEVPGIARRQSVLDARGAPTGRVPARQLLVLGITGGTIPCPAALVVLLSAVALHRVGFGLFLIAAFSLGLAVVLVAMGLLAVYAGRIMSRLPVEGPVVQKWLPLTSAAMITILGCAIAVRGLVAAGIVQIRI